MTIHDHSKFQTFKTRFESFVHGRPTKRPKLLSPQFHQYCRDLQGAIMQHEWPEHAAMLTVSLVGPEVKAVREFNSVTLDYAAKRHTGIIFKQLQAGVNGENKFKKGRAISPAFVVPERITRWKEGVPPKVTHLHYHAVIGFEDQDAMKAFAVTKAGRITANLGRNLKNGQPDCQNVRVLEVQELKRSELYPGQLKVGKVAVELKTNGKYKLDCDWQYSQPGEGPALFNYAAKYAYDLLEYVPRQHLWHRIGVVI